MNEETARAIAAGSIGLTVLGVGLAVAFCTRESRLKVRWDVVMLIVSVVAIRIMSAATSVHTDAVIASSAVVFGTLLGWAQGQRLNIRFAGDRVYARRGAASLAAWGTGLVITQAASLASRAQVIEIGQVLSYFGAGMALGLILGRQQAVGRATLARGSVAAGVVAFAFAAAYLSDTARPEPARAQAPETIEITAKVDPAPVVALLAEFSSGARPAPSEIQFKFSSAGGAVEGSGQVIVQNFHLGLLIAAVQGLAEAIGDSVGGAITGTGSSGGSTEVPPLPPELANCQATYYGAITLTGTLAGSGAMTGPASIGFSLRDPVRCPAEANGMSSSEFQRLSGTWKGTFDGQSLSGTITVSDRSGSLALPFSGAVAKVEPTAAPRPTQVPAAASGSNPPDDPAGGDNDDARDPFPPEDEEVTEEEAAGAGVLGAIAAAIAAGIAVLTSGGAAASGAAASGLGAGLVGSNGTAPEAKAPPEPAPRPPSPRSIDEENLAAAAAAIIARANTLGETGIAGRVESLLETGELTPEMAERLRAALKRREALAAWQASDGLYTKSDARAVGEKLAGDAKDALTAAGDLATAMGQPGLGAMLRNPEITARVGIAIASGGASEIAIAGIGIAEKVYTEATSPGENLDNFGAGIELTKIVGWEVGKEILMDKLGGKAIEGLGAAGKSLAPGLFGDAAQAVGKALPGNAVDDVAGAMAKSGDDIGGAVAKSADDVAGAGAKAEVPGSAADGVAGAGAKAEAPAPSGPAAGGGTKAEVPDSTADDVAGAGAKAEAPGPSGPTAGGGTKAEVPGSAADDVAGAGAKAEAPGPSGPTAGGGTKAEVPASAADDVAGAGAKAEAPGPASPTAGGGTKAEVPASAADDVAGTGAKAEAPGPSGPTAGGGTKAEVPASAADDVAGAGAKAEAPGPSGPTAGGGTKAEVPASAADDVAGAGARAEAPAPSGPTAGGGTKAEVPASAADEVAGAGAKAEAPGPASPTAGGGTKAEVPASAADDVAATGAKAEAPGPASPTAGGGTKAEVPGSLPKGPAATKPVPDLGPTPPPKVAPVPSDVDNKWLHDAPHGTKIPPNRLDETGWSARQREEMQRIAGKHDVSIAARTTNPDSLRHPTANPKPEAIKGKTINAHDVALGAREGDKGLAATFPPKYPGDNADPDLLKRYHERVKEWNKLSEELPALKDKGHLWDKNTGLFTDPSGVPYRGDIDLVYIRRMSDGKILTGDELKKVIDDLRASGVQVQHGAESGLVRDIANAGGDVKKAVELHSSLSANHGLKPLDPGHRPELTIEATAGGFQKGPSPFGMFDRLNPGVSPLQSRGIPMELPD